MEDLQSLYLRIENPIDNKIKWNKLLNMYSVSFDYEDFYSRITKNDKSDQSLLFDSEDKKTFCLVMWSIWKNKILSFTDDELRDFVERKVFDYDIYDVIGSVRNLESIKRYSDLQQVLTDPLINKYFSYLFDDYNHNVSIYSDFFMNKDIKYNTVFSIKVDAIKLYKILKSYINDCISVEIPYYIKFTEYGKEVFINFYTKIENFKKTEELLTIIKKENYMYFHSNYDILSGNIDDSICIRNEDVFNLYHYSRERSLIFFKSFDSVTYDYVVTHPNILVSFKEGRMNIIEYLSTYVMEKTISKIVDSTIKTNQDYFFIANSDDLNNLRKYIKDKLMIYMRDILKDRLYLKKPDEEIPIKINENKTIKITVDSILCAIRNLTLTLINKDNSLEKSYRIRIKNECQYYGVDYEKFCLDSGFSKKLFFNRKTLAEYEKEIKEIHDDIRKVENLEKLISSELNEETRSKIYDSMNELNSIFNVEEGQ